METIDYEKRSDMLAALLDARKRGIAVDVVGNGRSLRFPDGIGASDEEIAEAKIQEDEDALLGVVLPDPPAEVEEPAVEEVDPDAEVEEPAVEEVDPDAEVDEVEEPAVDEVEEDLIGDTTPATTSSKRKRKN